MTNVDQIFIRSIILFEFDQKKTEAETYKKIISVYNKDFVSNATVYNWYARFRSGDRSLENKPLPGAAPLIDKDKLQKLIAENPRFTLGELATILNVSKATVCRHLKNAKKEKKEKKAQKKSSWIPYEINGQKIN